MCGIAGAIGELQPDDLKKCGAMSARLSHRGPDDTGVWSWQVGESFGAILYHRRLSIIDLRAIAAEPMVSPVTGTTLVFNGEIYNFQELRAELEAAGDRFITKGDTEVILNGYDRWGEGVFGRLRGMFALVLVDSRNRRAIMARDGYGIKPLYWARYNGGGGKPAIAFASETRALIEAGFAERRTDAARIGQYLWNGFVPGPETIWTEVKEVPRGCYAVLDERNVEPRFERIWQIGSSLRGGSRITVDQADQIISETVKLHLIADVPLVVFLSGGVDSTAIAAVAARHTSDLHTLSVAFDEASADERHFAATAASAIGSQHHVIELSAAGILGQLNEAVAALDQPSFDGVNTWFVSREAARLGFKVALSGAGGDELFGGYRSFRRALLAERLAALPGSKIAASIAGEALRSLKPASKAGQLGGDFPALERMYQTQYALFSQGTLGRLLIDPHAIMPTGVAPVRARLLGSEIEGLSTLRAITAVESEMFLGDRLLRDMDSVSMAHSIEVRVPFVDTVLSDGIAGLSDRDRYLPIGQKRLLRRQSKGVLPDSFFSRPKRGFEFPMDSWMRGPLRPLIDSRLRDSAQCEALGLRQSEVAQIWRQFLDRPGSIYWTRPWALFALMQWASTNRASCH